VTHSLSRRAPGRAETFNGVRATRLRSGPRKVVWPSYLHTVLSQYCLPVLGTETVLSLSTVPNS